MSVYLSKNSRKFILYSAHLLTDRSAMKLNPGIYFCKITYSLHFELYRKLNSYLKWQQSF